MKLSMKIFVTAKPNSRENKVEKIDGTHYRVRVKAPPERGRANEAIVQMLAEYLGCPKSKITILTGHSSKNKIISLAE